MGPLLVGVPPFRLSGPAEIYSYNLEYVVMVAKSSSGIEKKNSPKPRAIVNENSH